MRRSLPLAEIAREQMPVFQANRLPDWQPYKQTIRGSSPCGSIGERDSGVTGGIPGSYPGGEGSTPSGPTIEVLSAETSRWSSGLSHHPVTVGIAGSNPVRDAPSSDGCGVAAIGHGYVGEAGRPQAVGQRRRPIRLAVDQSHPRTRRGLWPQRGQQFAVVGVTR